LIDPRNASFSSATTLGDVLIVINSFSYGIYVSISKDIITRNGAIKSIAWVFIFSSVVCVPLGFYSLSDVKSRRFRRRLAFGFVYRNRCDADALFAECVGFGAR
jgi:drug/metabolite transporter (DMT)-like permease